MKVLVIPDVHLKPWMFERAAQIMAAGEAEQAVCLMDIPDDWYQEYNLDLYTQTFDSAMRFQEQFPGTLWCYGNHELSYVWGKAETGFSLYAMETVRVKLAELKAALPDPNQIAYIHRIDNILFLHGGLTEDYVREHVPAEEYNDPDAVIVRINGFGCEEIWDEDSPVWFRPQDVLAPMYMQDELVQVVGHTPMEHVETFPENVISCDVFSTYRFGGPIGTQEFVIIDSETGDITCRGREDVLKDDALQQDVPQEEEPK